MNDLSLQTIHEQEQEITALRATIAEKDEALTIQRQGSDVWMLAASKATSERDAAYQNNVELTKLRETICEQLSTARAESASSALRVEAMRNALILVKFYYEIWNNECDLPASWPRHINGNPKTVSDIVNEAITAPPSETLAKVRGDVKSLVESAWREGLKSGHSTDNYFPDEWWPKSKAHAAAQSALALIGGTK